MKDGLGFFLVALMLALLALAFIAPTASAHHSPGHRVLAIGVPTKLPVRIPACSKKEYLDEFMAVHAERGYWSAMSVMARLNRERGENDLPKCGIVQTRIIVLGVVMDGIELPFPDAGSMTITVVRFKSPTGDEELIGALPDVRVVENPILLRETHPV